MRNDVAFKTKILIFWLWQHKDIFSTAAKSLKTQMKHSFINLRTLI